MKNPIKAYKLRKRNKKIKKIVNTATVVLTEIINIMEHSQAFQPQPQHPIAQQVKVTKPETDMHDIITEHLKRSGFMAQHPGIDVDSYIAALMAQKAALADDAPAT